MSDRAPNEGMEDLRGKWREARLVTPEEIKTAIEADPTYQKMLEKQMDGCAEINALTKERWEITRAKILPLDVRRNKLRMQMKVRRLEMDRVAREVRKEVIRKKYAEIRHNLGMK